MAAPGLGNVSWMKFEKVLQRRGLDSAYALTKQRHRKEGMSSSGAAETSSREWLSALRGAGELTDISMCDGDFAPGRFTVEGLKALLPAPAVAVADALSGCVSVGGMDEWTKKQLAVLKSGRQAKDAECIRWVLSRASIPIEAIEADDIPGPQAVTYLRAAQTDHTGFVKQALTQIVKLDPDFGERSQDGDVDLKSSLLGMLDAFGKDGSIDPTKGVEGLDLAGAGQAVASSGGSVLSGG